MKSKLGSIFALSRFAEFRSAARDLAVSRFVRDQRGSYLVFMAMLLPFLVTLAGLAVEGGYWLFNHRVAQSAADNAAYSAATALAINSDSTNSDLLLQAKGIAGNDFGLVSGSNGVTVTMNKPPVGTCFPSSQYIGATPTTGAAIEVVVQQSLSRLFSKMLFSGNVGICGRAVAILSGGGQCVLALGKTGTDISATKNNLSINFTGCGFFANSSDAASISITGNNDQIQAESVGTVGGAVVGGNLKTKVSVTTGNPPIDDPYATQATSWPTTQATAPTTPTLPTAPSISASGSAGAVTPASGCTSGKNAITSVTLGAGTWATSSLNSAGLNKCTTEVKLSGGSYSFPSGLALPNGATLTVVAASNIAVAAGGISASGLNVTGTFNLNITAGGLSTGSGAVNFSAASNIYIAAGGWSGTGAVTFASGNSSISVLGTMWTTSGGISFLGGNYTINVTGTGTCSGDSGVSWCLSGASTFGAGTYNITTSGGWKIIGAATNFGAGTYFVKTGGSWIISPATTFGNGTFNVTVGGNWVMNNAVTLGSGNYTFAVTGDVTTSGNFAAGSGTYSGSMANWNITGTSTTIGNGIYYLSGNFNANGTGNQTITASSATLVLTGATSIVNYTANNSTLTLTAPVSGWSQGIAIWEPTSTGTNQFASGNNSIATIQGVVYAPSAAVQYLGNTGSSVCTQIVAKSVVFGGNSINFKGGCSGTVPGMKTFGQIIALVE
jgi:Flp pilus assembly protein TadG